MGPIMRSTVERVIAGKGARLVPSSDGKPFHGGTAVDGADGRSRAAARVVARVDTSARDSGPRVGRGVVARVAPPCRPAEN